MGKLKVTELEYHELASLQPFANMRVGFRVQTTPETADEDFINLVIKVKTELSNLITQKRVELAEEKKSREAQKKAQEIFAGEKK